MKKFIRVLEALILLAAIVVAVMVLFNAKEPPKLDEVEPREEVRKSVENKEIARSKKRPQITLAKPTTVPTAGAKVEPTKEPRFEDLPPEKQAQFLEGRAKIYDEAYARRFKMTIEEWNALSPKEQRILIRKGKRE